MTPTPMVVPLASPGTPVTFQLNGTGELELKSVQATVDGSAAAATFDAVLSVYTQDDKLISRTKPSSSIAAGDSAIVTWAPFLRKQAAAAAGGSLATMFRVYPTGNLTCPTGVATTLTFGTTAINLGSAFTTADSKTFTLAKGVWLLGASLMVDYTSAGTTTAVSEYSFNNGGATLSTKQFTLDGISHNGGNVSYDHTFLANGSAANLAFNVTLFNFEGFDLLVRSAGDLSSLYGVLVQPA